MCFIDVKSGSCLDQEDLYQQAPNTANIKRPIHLHCYLKSTGYVTRTLLFFREDVRTASIVAADPTGVECLVIDRE